MVTKIISGGQVGADIAGLRAAKILGIETGGWMPKGFKTIDGPKPEYAEMYGIIEMETEEYAPRTKMNVVNSDGTIRFARNFNTRGEKATIREVHKANKPCFDVLVNYPGISVKPFKQCADWLRVNKIKVLNVAGNASYDIEEIVQHYLIRALVREKNASSSTYIRSS